MTKSPFPGMDPYLEQDWLDVHSALVTYIRDQIQDQLPPDLLARMESRVVLEDAAGLETVHRHPDVRVVEAPPSGGTAVIDRPALSSIQPDMLVTRQSDPAAQKFIEIVDAQTRRRIVTTIELVSPTNKLPGPDRKRYLAKRDECSLGGVNLVEIDLTRQGDRVAIFPWLARVAQPPTYIACVHRAQDGDDAVYFLPLDQPLKPMRIPLRPADEDVVLSLQPLVETAYVRGRYDTLDYSAPLDPPLTGGEAEFAKRMLLAAGIA